MPGMQAQRHAGRAQLDDAVVGADVRQVVPGVGDDDPARRRVEDREQAGHEHPGRHLRHQQVVGAGQDLARRVAAGGLGAEDASGSGP